MFEPGKPRCFATRGAVWRFAPAMHMLTIDRGFSAITLACDVSQLAGPSWEAVADLSWLYDSSVVVALGLRSEDAPRGRFDGWVSARTASLGGTCKVLADPRQWELVSKSELVLQTRQQRHALLVTLRSIGAVGAANSDDEHLDAAVPVGQVVNVLAVKIYKGLAAQGLQFDADARNLTLALKK